MKQSFFENEACGFLFSDCLISFALPLWLHHCSSVLCAPTALKHSECLKSTFIILQSEK